MITNADPDVLDQILSQHQNPWYSRGCRVGKLVLSLEPGEFRTKLVAYMNLSVEELGHAPIQSAVAQTLGVEIRSDTLGRHRRHSCSCPPEVWQ